MTDGLTEGQRQLIALGRFVLEFAEAERFVLDTLWVLGNITDEVARATMSGVRADAAIQYINRIFEMRKVDKVQRAPYPEVFEHFSWINKTRNLLLHHGIEYGGLSTYTTDRSRALTPEKEKFQRISTEILDDMTHDLRKIIATLLFGLFKLERQTLEIDKELSETLRQPWRYKPTEPLHPQKPVGP